MPGSSNLVDQEELEALQDDMKAVGEPTEKIANVSRVAAVDAEFFEDMREVYRRKRMHEEPIGRPFATPYPAYLGEFMLGVDPEDRPVCITRQQLNEHMLVVGRSGAGKTTLFYNLMDQLTVPFWAFDLKQDYRHFLRQDKDLLVLPWTELKFNPLKPPEGVSPRRWAQVFSDVFGHATALLSGSKNYQMSQLIELYQLYGLFDAVADPYPSLHELQVVMQQDKINYVRKQANYRDTVVNRLEAMNLTVGTIFDCSTGYPLEELLERNVVFEFDGLGTDLQNFLMETLFAYVFEYRLAHNQRDSGLRHVFLLDEGKQVFSVYKERQDAAGIPPIDELTAKMREFGEGLIVADQEATKLTDSIKANTATTILLATGDATQFQDVAASMHLTERQAALAQSLGPGQAIVHSGNHDPCPVLLTDVDLEKTLSDAALRVEQRAAWNQLSSTPRDVPKVFAEQVDHSRQVTEETGAIPVDPPAEIALSQRATQLLTDVVEHPFRPLSDRYSAFGSMEKGVRAKQELVEAGVVVERTVSTRQEKRKLLELTERGRTYVETRLELDPKRRGRGGIIHQYWQHRLQEVFEAAGWTAKLEVFDADVYVNMGGTELVVEVAMGNSEREVAHVARHLETGFDAVWVVCRNTAVRDGLRERLAETGPIDDRVTFRLFRDVPWTDPAAFE